MFIKIPGKKQNKNHAAKNSRLRRHKPTPENEIFGSNQNFPGPRIFEVTFTSPQTGLKIFTENKDKFKPQYFIIALHYI